MSSVSFLKMDSVWNGTSACDLVSLPSLPRPDLCQGLTRGATGHSSTDLCLV